MEESLCSKCRFNKASYTELVGNHIVKDWYCELKNDDIYCGREDFEED